MKYLFLCTLFFLNAIRMYGQQSSEPEKGVVSYLSSENVYVKFESTDDISIGDTLYISKNDKRVPALVVDHKSSISCVCTPLYSQIVKVSDPIYTRVSETGGLDKNIEEKLLEEKRQALDSGNSTAGGPGPRFSSGNTSSNQRVNDQNPSGSPVITPDTDEELAYQEKLNGRISATSYNTISGERKTQTMRYVLSFRGDHVGNSRFSVENYISFRHTLHEWSEVKDNLSQALKIYSLAAKYDFNPGSSITLGRKINPKISSMGAVDGLQLEMGLGHFTLGAIAGTRPDYQDYGFTIHLPQYGAYISHEITNHHLYLQSTLAFMEQRNHSEIDRRSIYFQHSGSILKDLYLFTSIELSLYENINDHPQTVFNLNNLYLLLRYSLSRKWSFSASYDNRKNIIYYESYKNFIDQLIEDETRQGLRFHVNYHPFKNVSLGVNTGWRFQKSDMNTSKNLNTYLTLSRITSLNILATLNADFLHTNYLNSRIFGIRISKEIISGKLSGDINFRNVYYRYLNYENASRQNIAGANFSLRIMNNLSLYSYYEGIFDASNQVYHRLNLKIVQRF